MRKLDRSLCQVHFKWLHNDMHMPCSLQSPHYPGIGMITSVWKMPVNCSVRDTRIVTPLGFTIDFKCHCRLYCQNCSGNCSWTVKAPLAEFAVGTNAGLSLCTIQNGSLDSKERQTRTQATWTTQSNLVLTWKPDVCVCARALSLYGRGQTHKCVWAQEECVCPW